MLSASEDPDVKNNSQNPSVFVHSCKKTTLFKRLHDLFHTLYLVMQNEEKIELKILRCSTLNFALMVNLCKQCREENPTVVSSDFRNLRITFGIA